MVSPEILHELALKHSDKTKFFAVSFFFFFVCFFYIAGSSTSQQLSLTGVFGLLFGFAAAQCFFIVCFLLSFRSLGSRQSTDPMWYLVSRVLEWVKTIIMLLVLPMPLIALIITVFVFIGQAI